MTAIQPSKASFWFLDLGVTWAAGRRGSASNLAAAVCCDVLGRLPGQAPGCGWVFSPYSWAQGVAPVPFRPARVHGLSSFGSHSLYLQLSKYSSCLGSRMDFLPLALTCPVPSKANLSNPFNTQFEAGYIWHKRVAMILQLPWESGCEFKGEVNLSSDVHVF